MEGTGSASCQVAPPPWNYQDVACHRTSNRRADPHVLELREPTQLSILIPAGCREDRMLSEGLRLIRVFHDVSQKDLAKKLDVAQSYLSEIEKGKKSPTLAILEKYSQVFGIPTSSILFFSEAMDSNTPSEKARIAISKKIIRLLEFIEQRGSRVEEDNETSA